MISISSEKYSHDLSGSTLIDCISSSWAVFSNYRIADINNNGLTPGSNNRDELDIISADGIINYTYTNLSSSVVDVIYSIVQISADGCEGEVFTVRVTINPEPKVADQEETVCSDDSIDITLNPSTSVAVSSYTIINTNASGLTEVDPTLSPAISNGILSAAGYSNN